MPQNAIWMPPNSNLPTHPSNTALHDDVEMWAAWASQTAEPAAPRRAACPLRQSSGHKRLFPLPFI